MGRCPAARFAQRARAPVWPSARWLSPRRRCSSLARHSRWVRAWQARWGSSGAPRFTRRGGRNQRQPFRNGGHPHQGDRSRGTGRRAAKPRSARLLGWRRCGSARIELRPVTALIDEVFTDDFAPHRASLRPILRLREAPRTSEDCSGRARCTQNRAGRGGSEVVRSFVKAISGPGFGSAHWDTEYLAAWKVLIFLPSVRFPVSRHFA